MGGGGDGGFEARQAEIERRKQEAREALNYQFGYGGGGRGRTAVDRNAFNRVVNTPPPAGSGPLGSPPPEGWGIGGATEAPPPTSHTVFDEAGYNAAVAAAEAEAAAGNPNRGAREALYQTVRDSAFNAGRRRLDEGKQEAARKLKFELFAKGLAGGSEDVNQNALMGRTYGQGVIDLGGKADAARAQFRSGDETSRLSLLQSIDAGMDQGSALSSAAQQMQINADRSAADAMGTDLGNLFDTSAFLFNQSQYRQGRQQGGQEWWNQYAPRNRTSAGNPGGVTTRLPGE